MSITFTRYASGLKAWSLYQESNNLIKSVLAHSGDDANDDVTLNVHDSFEAVMADMRIHEATKRSLFNVPMQFGDGFTIAVKGYA